MSEFFTELFFILALLSIGAFIVGMIHPTVFGKEAERKVIGLISITVLVISLIAGALIELFFLLTLLAIPAFIIGMIHPTIFGKEANRKVIAIISISVFVINLFVGAIIVFQYTSGLDKEDTNEWKGDTNPIIERIIKETLEDTIESVE